MNRQLALNTLKARIKSGLQFGMLILPVPLLANGLDSYDNFPRNMHYSSTKYEYMYNGSQPNRVFNPANSQTQNQELHIVDYSSSVTLRNTEWTTRFDAKNLYEQDPERRNDLHINSFYLDYTNNVTDINAVIGRQASPGKGIFSRIDGVSLRAPILSNISGGITFGFPVDSSDSNQIQQNKPLTSLNVKLPKLYNVLEINPYFVVQKEDGFVNRQSFGSEFMLSHGNKRIYQIADYDLQFNELNMWLIEGKLYKSNDTLYYASWDFKRDPILELNNSLDADGRVNDLKSLSSVMSREDMLLHAKKRSTKNYTTKFGSSFPLNSRVQFGADFYRFDQFYASESSALDDDSDLEHNYKNKVSTQLVTDNIFLKRDLVSLEFTYANTEQYSNSSFTISDQLNFNSLYKMDFMFKVEESESIDGEILLATLPSARFTCQCSKRFYTEIEISYESLDYSGTSNQLDMAQVYANWNVEYSL